MLTLLDSVETRVLGSLVEKQVMTPEYYPLTLNALVQACNQKTSRDPVVSYDEGIVSRALEVLRGKNLVYVFYGSGSRVPKYKHMMREVYALDAAELAVVVGLMLRGAQTLGEIRERAGRLHDFPAPGELEQSLDALLTRQPEPLVMKLPRRVNHKDARYVHLLAGELDFDLAAPSSTHESSTPNNVAHTDRVTDLEQQVATLREKLDALRLEFDDFRKQF